MRLMLYRRICVRQNGTDEQFVPVFVEFIVVSIVLIYFALCFPVINT